MHFQTAYIWWAFRRQKARVHLQGVRDNLRAPGEHGSKVLGLGPAWIQDGAMHVPWFAPGSSLI